MKKKLILLVVFSLIAEYKMISSNSSSNNPFVLLRNESAVAKMQKELTEEKKPVDYYTKVVTEERQNIADARKIIKGSKDILDSANMGLKKHHELQLNLSPEMQEWQFGDTLKETFYDSGKLGLGIGVYTLLQKYGKPGEKVESIIRDFGTHRPHNENSIVRFMRDVASASASGIGVFTDIMVAGMLTKVGIIEGSNALRRWVRSNI